MMRSFLRSIALAGCVAAAPAYANVFTPITGDASYKLTFDEEFNGTAVNNTVWQVTYDGNSDQTYGTYPNAYFWNSTNMTVGGGSLDLAVSKVGSNYHTAAITTSFLQTYGYWEARVKMPANARGIGTNFWTDANGWNFPEIDISEWLGNLPSSNYTTWHYKYPNDGTNGTGISQTVTGIDFTKWHVVGMLWTPAAVTWYYDGVQVFTTSIDVNSTNAIEQWTILGATVGGFNGNVVDSSTVFPAHYQVDYVHIYSNASGAVAVTPQANYGGPGDTGGTVTRATASLAANPTSIHGGASSTLSWQSTNASTCTGGGFSTGGAISGRAVVHPTNTTVYSVSCAGATAAASVTVRN